MAQEGVQMVQDDISCSTCLDLFKDPVIIPCGHTYCMNCIKVHWDAEEEEQTYSCSQCRETFTPRPVLLKNTTLANLMEHLKVSELKAGPDDHCYDGNEDVSCDFCTGKKLNAVKSCLDCLLSLCEKHLSHHRESPVYEKHKLVEPSKTLQMNFCPHHNEAKKMFCRTDKQCICYICSVDEHKGHDILLAAAERTERQRELAAHSQTIHNAIQARVEDVKLLQQHMETLSDSAHKTMEDIKMISTKMISVWKRKITSKLTVDVSCVNELRDPLENEIANLKRRVAVIAKLLATEDDNEFLRKHHTLSHFSPTTQSCKINFTSPRNFEDISRFVKATSSDLNDKLQHLMNEEWTDITSHHLMKEDTLPPQPRPEPVPKPKDDFLKYSSELTLDPNTANRDLLLSEGNRKAALIRQKHFYFYHQDKFTVEHQALSKESLSGKCYWEVEWSGQAIDVAVSYSDIKRFGWSDECKFGKNNRSWALNCSKNSPTYTIWKNGHQIPVPGPQSFRIGVYLDQSAGILSFYSISETVTLLHRLQTTFTQPLYAGIGLHGDGTTAEFCKLK